jgi:hypothetical protein
MKRAHTRINEEFMAFNNNLRRQPIVSTRPSFMSKPVASWHGHLSVFIYIAGLLQFVIFLCHLLWMAERGLARWLWGG